ncbi:hypothetical protein [Botrimarina sp.]|uniref:hypothetical protein n=1 Tax=Botrimarina sp. TaxID=2795802 RepID=UPI0032EF6A1C
MRPLSRSQSRALLLLCVAAPAALAWSPRVTRVEPRGLQRGAACEVVVAGERLGNATGLLFDGGGIAVESIAVNEDDELAVAVRAADDCPLGEHRFLIVGPRGLSEMATLHVGPFPIAKEQEPNDTPDGAQSIERGDGLTIRGVIDEADVDCFAVELAAGERLSVDVVAMRLGAAFFDAFIDVVDPSGTVVASADDDPVSLQDPRLSFVAETEGPHVLRIREAAFGGDFESRYLVHVGDFPVVQSALPAGGPGGELAAVLLSDARGPIKARLELPFLPAASWLRWRASDAGAAVSPTPIPLRVAELRNVVEGSESSDDVGAAPVALNGVLSEPGESDRYGFQAIAGELLEVEVFAARVGSPVDAVIAVDGPGGPLVRNDDDGAIHDSRARFRVAQTGRHELSIRDHLGRGGPSHAYRIEVAPVQPSLALTTPILDPLRPQESQRIHVPRGGRTAVLVAARRDRFDGPVTIDFGDLPSGVRATVDPIPPGEHLTVALLEAEADAPLTATLSRVAGYGDGPSGTVIGSLSHEVGLVFGEPRRTVYYGPRIDRTPIAVTEPPPFRITVEPPRSPLARDGRKDLVVRVDRGEGFDGPVTITSPRLPEWVERSEDPVTIEAGQTETVFPLIATDRAAPGEHTVLFVGAARIDGAEVAAASDRTPVRLVAPHAELRIAHTTVEQGNETTVRCLVDWIVDSPGAATATLHGLPKHATAPRVTLAPGQSEFAFPVRAGADTPAALHNTLFVELAVGEPPEPVRQFVGRGGVLEVVAPGGAARRQISRLEELRREAARARSAARPQG